MNPAAAISYGRACLTSKTPWCWSSKRSKFGITLAPGSYYRPNGEVSAWVRINTAHADDPRAIRFFEHMGQFVSKRV